MRIRTVFLILFWLIARVFVYGQVIELCISGNINGAIADCNCGGRANGSLARLVTFYKQFKGNNQIWIDSGNLLTSYPLHRHNEFMLRKFSELHYDIVGVGENEFLQGNEFFSRNVLHNDKLPWLLTSLKSEERLPVMKKREVVFGGIKFLFLNIWSQRLMNPDLREYIYFDPPENQLRKVDLKTYGEDHIIILIFQGPLEEGKRLLKRFPEITGIILGYNEEPCFVLESQGKSFIMSPGVEAEYVGRVILNFNNKEINNISGKIIDLRIVAQEDNFLLEEYEELESHR